MSVLNDPLFAVLRRELIVAGASERLASQICYALYWAKIRTLRDLFCYCVNPTPIRNIGRHSRQLLEYVVLPEKIRNGFVLWCGQCVNSRPVARSVSQTVARIVARPDEST